MKTLTAAAFLSLSVIQIAQAQTIEFIPIPGQSAEPGCNENVCIISGTTGYSGVRVSADGSTVATIVFQPGPAIGYIPRYAARWTREGGTQVISPDLPGLYPPVGISADGSVIYGESWRWRATGGYQANLPFLNAGIFGSQNRLIFGVSDDGLTVAGVQGIYPEQGDMFTARPATQQVTLLPRAPQVPTGYFYFNTISGDGTVVAGSTRRINTTDPFAFDRYTGVLIRTGAAPSTTLVTPEGGQAGVTDLSFNGSVAVGYLSESFTLRAFRWSADEGLQLLQEGLGGSDSSYARAVSADGSVVVGDYLNFGVGGTRAWIWRRDLGFVDLLDYASFTLGGADALSGWRLLVATDISADGKTIVGQGLNPAGVEQAFLLRIVDATCEYDYNRDENIDLLDAQQMAQVFVGTLNPSPEWLDGDLNFDESFDLTDAQLLATFVVTGTCGV
jgi:uncharacterized membrane protein